MARSPIFTRFSQGLSSRMTIRAFGVGGMPDQAQLTFSDAFRLPVKQMTDQVTAEMYNWLDKYASVFLASKLLEQGM